MECTNTRKNVFGNNYRSWNMPRCARGWDRIVPSPPYPCCSIHCTGIKWTATKGIEIALTVKSKYWQLLSAAIVSTDTPWVVNSPCWEIMSRFRWMYTLWIWLFLQSDMMMTMMIVIIIYKQCFQISLHGGSCWATNFSLRKFFRLAVSSWSLTKDSRSIPGLSLRDV